MLLALIIPFVTWSIMLGFVGNLFMLQFVTPWDTLLGMVCTAAVDLLPLLTTTFIISF